VKVAIFGQTDQNNTLAYALELIHELMAVDAEIHIEEAFSRMFSTADLLGDYPTYTAEKGLDDSFDLFVSFGGDGTVLRAITFVQDLGIPIIGVNTGRLGFLLIAISPTTEIPEFSNLNFALNEITFSRKNTTSMITVETYLNDEYLTSYWADGLIVATPTGSTGYSLSCGGPVIAPTAKSLILTPIAPHNLNARPLVISDDTIIRLKVYGREESHLVSLDSRIATVENEREIILKKADFNIKMVEYISGSFLKTLRNKLLWGEDRRN